NMVNENAPTPAPTSSNDLILPFNAWEEKTRVYHFHSNEDWFLLNASLLREALEITPIVQAHQFESPPLGDANMHFVNALVYLEEIHFVSKMAVNNLYQPWRAISSMINQCLPSKGKGIATDEHVAQSLLDLHKPEKKSTTDQFLLQRRTLATEEASTRPSTQPEDDTSTNIVQQGEYVAKKVDLDEKTAEIDEGQTGTNPGETPESRPPLKRVLIEEDQAGPNPRQSHVFLVKPDTEPMHDDFVATVYPQVHESLKHSDEEHFHLENPLSSTGTLSSMKNMDAYSFSDQFFNYKPIEEDPRKTNMEFKVESMVTILIHQASSSIPLLSTPTIETKTTTLPPPPP
nr:hypothetical protein [Tanacetum cinerariifolium]